MADDEQLKTVQLYDAAELRYAREEKDNSCNDLSCEERGEAGRGYGAYCEVLRRQLRHEVDMRAPLIPQTISCNTHHPSPPPPPPPHPQKIFLNTDKAVL